MAGLGRRRRRRTRGFSWRTALDSLARVAGLAGLLVTALSLVGLTVGHAATAAPAAPWGDGTQSQGSRISRDVALLRARGILPAGTAAMSTVTRGELAQWLVRALLGTPGHDVAPGDALAIAAAWQWVPRDWQAQAGTAGPETAGQPVTRLDLALVATALLGPARGQWPDGVPWPPDAAGLPPSSQAAARAALANGLLGTREGLLAPHRPPTRDEAAAWCVRLLELSGHLFDAEGELAAVRGDVLVLRMGERNVPVRLAPAAAVYRNGAPAAVTDLQVDDEVRVIWTAGDHEPPAAAGGAPVAAVADAFSVGVHGVVARVDWSSRQLSLSGVDPVTGGSHPVALFDGGSLRTYRVEDDAPTHLNGRPAPLAALRPGDRVTVLLRRVGGTVRRIQAARFDAEGTVADVDPVHGWIRLGPARTTAKPAVDTWVLADGAVVVRNGRSVTLEDVAPGETAAVAAWAPGVAGYVEIGGSTTGGRVRRP